RARRAAPRAAGPPRAPRRYARGPCGLAPARSSRLAKASRRSAMARLSTPVVSRPDADRRRPLPKRQDPARTAGGSARGDGPLDARHRARSSQAGRTPRAGQGRGVARRGARRRLRTRPGRGARPCRCGGGSRGVGSPCSGRQRRSAAGDLGRPARARGRCARTRRRDRRHDERACADRSRSVRAALRSRQRRAVRGNRAPAGRPAESRRRRRHARGCGCLRAVLLSGGVGGARFALGLVDVLDPADVTVIGNVGDDLEVFGLHVSPDLDTLLYTLAGVADEERGWGRAGETWTALEAAAELGADAWFQLGDRDLGLHLARAESLRCGQPLSRAIAQLAAALGVETAILPATDDPVRTWLVPPAG